MKDAAPRDSFERLFARFGSSGSGAARAELELAIAHARIVLSLATLVSIYVDPAIGGLFGIDPSILGVLVVHLLYGIGVHWIVRRRPGDTRPALASAALDVGFAAVLSHLTEGHTSPSYAFFAFAIIAVGCRTGLRATLFVTFASVALYLFLIVFLSREARDLYVMRPAYLALTGYLIGFLGQQRARFEAQLAERQHIARFLHDGYVQGLAGVHLRLETARELLRRQRVDETQTELTELQTEVAREFDQVRAYIHTLADVESGEGSKPLTVERDPNVRVEMDFAATGRVVEQAFQMMLEGVRNTRRHAQAGSASIRAVARGERLEIAIDDDGVGFGRVNAAPWSIAARVAELGGRCSLLVDGRPGAHLVIDVPAR